MSDKWWDAKESEVHLRLIALIKKLDQRQHYRAAENTKYVKLYGNTDILGLSTYLYAQPNPISAENRVTFNVIQSCVDTAAAKIAKNKPLPKFMTDGADWKLRQRAINLNKFMAGSFYQAKTHERSQRCFIDGAVFGTGIKKVFAQGKKIISERVIPDEIVVDDAEGWYGTPRNIYQVKGISRDILKEQYPEKEKEIDALKPITGLSGYANYEHSDLVHVIEGWHLPSKKNGKDGRHVIAVLGADLFDEKWTKTTFPFAIFKYNPKLVGWYGQGLAEMLVGKQIEINKLLKNIQIAHHLLSSPAVYVENNAKVPTAQLNNEIGRIVRYYGTKPTVEVFQTMHPEIYAHLKWLIQSAYEETGISSLSAQSKKPAGLDSGAALREYNDIESERFVQVGQRWEQFHLDEAELHIQCAKDIAERYPDYAVPVKSKDSVEYIRWKDVSLEDSEYVMQCFPVSSLPRDPAARKQFVQELAQSGYIDPDTTIELLDFPDLEAYQNKRLAMRNVIRSIINKILVEGEFTPPEPFFDLAFAAQEAKDEYNLAKMQGAPEENLELLRRFIAQVDILSQQAQPQQQPDAPMSIDPTGVPAAPPVAPLLPTNQAGPIA